VVGAMKNYLLFAKGQQTPIGRFVVDEGTHTLQIILKPEGSSFNLLLREVLAEVKRSGQFPVEIDEVHLKVSSCSDQFVGNFLKELFISTPILAKMSSG
jgi:hypothetical protein